MIHLRIVVPARLTAQALELLDESPSVTNVIVVRDAGLNPRGDMILCDVADEEASDAITDLRDLGIERDGSIAIGPTETELSRVAAGAEKAARGHSSDAVVWEEVEERTLASAKLSVNFLLFMTIAVLIAALGIYLNSAILIIGAMIVGPDFGPIAGVCVAAVDRQPSQTGRSLLALLVGYVLGIIAAYFMTWALREMGLLSQHFDSVSGSLANALADPEPFTVLVALLAGTAGMLSLTTAKSGVLIGVVVSVTTIPTAANIAVTMAYSQGEALRASLLQLAANIGAMLVAGIITLAIQRVLHWRRRTAHLRALARRETGSRR